MFFSLSSGIDLVDQSGQFLYRANDVRSTCGKHALFHFRYAGLQFAGRHRPGFFFGKCHLVTAENHAYAPHFRVHPFFDIGNRISYFHYGIQTGDSQLRQILKKSCKEPDDRKEGGSE